VTGISYGDPFTGRMHEDELILLFADTQIEDEDTYRFPTESAAGGKTPLSLGQFRVQVEQQPDFLGKHEWVENHYRQRRRSCGGSVKATLRQGEPPDESYGWFGGITPAPSWDEYLDSFNDIGKEVVTAVRACIEENNMVGAKAGDVCNDTWFEMDNGKSVTFTWRGWGDLMQAIVDKREGYMAYYM